ncbi:MAG: hypothetical protein M3Q63_01260 [bacterium]|nr:hypothetical protein [bacterium]
MKNVLLSIAALGFLPSFASAQGAQQVDVTGLSGTVQGLTVVVNYAIPLLLAIAVIAFIIGVIKYLFAGGADAKAAAKDHLIYGIVGITVILAIFGIARLLINLFGLNPAQLSGTEVPSIPISQPIDGVN